MQGVLGFVAFALGAAWFVASMTWWIAGFLAYFNNFSGVAKFAGVFLLPIAALPVVGKGELTPGSDIEVKGYYWWWGILLVLVLMGLTGFFGQIAERTRRSVPSAYHRPDDWDIDFDEDEDDDDEMTLDELKATLRRRKQRRDSEGDRDRPNLP